MHRAIDVIGRPAALVLKQPDGANRLVLAQIEPVLRPFRHVDEDADLDLDGEYRMTL